MPAFAEHPTRNWCCHASSSFTKFKGSKKPTGSRFPGSSWCLGWQEGSTCLSLGKTWIQSLDIDLKQLGDAEDRMWLRSHHRWSSWHLDDYPPQIYSINLCLLLNHVQDLPELDTFLSRSHEQFNEFPQGILMHSDAWTAWTQLSY